METQSAKKRRADDDGSVISIDRISELPQAILHHILSLVSQKDAVQTCVLSKSWRYLWHGRSNVEFIEESLGNEIWPFLDKTLQRYRDQNLSIRQFVVDMQSMPDSVSKVLLKKWITIGIMNLGVRALSLQFHWSNTFFAVPLVVFQAEFLVELNLRGCTLNQIKSTDNVLCKHLQKLCLNDVNVDDETFDKIMSSCPLIENLDIQSCEGLRTIKAKNTHNLKHIDWSPKKRHERISFEIESPSTLESIRILQCHDWFLQYNNTFFPHLRSLNLHWVRLSDESFNNFSSNFPCLNALTLDFCYGFKHLLLMSCSIKRLTINLCQKRINASIDTPNIIYFQCSVYEYGFLPSIKFTSYSKKWRVSHISVGYNLKSSDNDATKWFLDLHELLKGLSQSRIITLSLHKQRYRKLHIEDSCGGFSKPVAVETLRFSGFSTTSSASDILNYFFRVCRPRYIHMNRCAKGRSQRETVNRELVEFVFKLIPAETRRCYLWLQDLEEVRMGVWNMKAQEWHWVEEKSLPALPKKNEEQQIRFRLKWRDQQSKFTQYIDLSLYSYAQTGWLIDDNQLTEFVFKILMNERIIKRSDCLWQKDLEELNLETFNENRQVWGLVQRTHLAHCALPKKQKYRFRFKWREYVQLALLVN